jgi:hypothetical protein
MSSTARLIVNTGRWSTSVTIVFTTFIAIARAIEVGSTSALFVLGLFAMALASGALVWFIWRGELERL